MLRNSLILILLAMVGWLVFERSLTDIQPPLVNVADPGASRELEPIVPLDNKVDPAYSLVDISVHTPEELDVLFDQIEAVLKRPRSRNEEAFISIVLHGPEVEFFAFRNYEKYQSLVDRAATLAALGAVDISICQSRMQSYGIAEDQVPAFLRQVPYGPDEVKKQLEEGYIRM